METRENLRNIAIIAHVDHGKNNSRRPALKNRAVFSEQMRMWLKE